MRGPESMILIYVCQSTIQSLYVSCLSVSGFAGQSANQSDLIFDSVSHSVSQSVSQSLSQSVSQSVY